ncbi:MAG: T9SS type A sorting domain-containing protein [Candidatus Hydrothermae bacterium]|nr:T9SS type A sorting domain-containing protein [Candidatus Hydrothermae bacterium]
MVRRFAVYVLLLVPISLLASWTMQVPHVAAFPGQALAIPIFGTTQDSIRGFEFQMAFCDDGDSLKLAVDSVTLKGYGAPYVTIFDTLSTVDSWTLDVNLGNRSMYWGTAYVGSPEVPSVPAFDSAVIYVMWAHVESSVNAPDTVELDLNNSPECPPGNEYDCGFLDSQFTLRIAELEDGELSVIPYSLELTFMPGQPQNFPEGEANQITVQGASSDTSDVLLLELVDGLESWMGWSGSDTGNVVEGYLELDPGHCDDGLYEVRFRLTSLTYDTSVVQVDTVIVYDADRPPFFVSVAPGDGIYGAGSLIQESVVFGDSDMACPMGHVTDFLTLSYYLIPEPTASSPEFVDNGDGSGLFQWTPAEEDEGSYTLGLVATDIYGLSDTVEVSLEVRAQPGYLDYSYRLQLKQMCAFSGRRVYFPVYLSNPEPVSGYEVLIAYDSTYMSLHSVEEAIIDGFASEYFSYNLMPSGQQDIWPSVRIIEIRDVANAWYTPPIPADTGQVLFYLVFDIRDSVPPNINCDIKFLVNDCSDNTISDTTGLILHTSRIMDVAYQNEISGSCSFEEYLVDSCGTAQVAKDVALVDGFEQVPDSSCCPSTSCPTGGLFLNPADPGDINLNGLTYEIGDAIFFSQVIIGTFVQDVDTTTPPTGWTAEDWFRASLNSDLNYNGIYWEMGDFSLLVSRINGFTNPPDSGLDGAVAQIDFIGDGIYLNTPVALSVIYLGIRYRGKAGRPDFSPLTDGLMVNWNDLGGEMRILLWGTGNRYIPAGKHRLLSLSGKAQYEVIDAAVAGLDGKVLNIRKKSRELPFSSCVSPNPFSGNVNLELEIKRRGVIDVSVYDVSGRLVKKIFGGYLNPGSYKIVWRGEDSRGKQVGSGIYFVRVEAGKFNKTHEVFLLK